MANFLEAFELTNKIEAGFTKDPADNGNWTGGLVGSGELIGTMSGVSAPLLAKFIGRVPTMDEMRSLPIETVRAIFKKYFWDKLRGDEIKTQFLANKVYDNCINFGIHGGIVQWQRDVLEVPETGVMDEVTLNKLNQQS